MMKWCFLLFLSVFQICSASLKLSDEEYELMPPVVSLDPFETCLRHPGGLYCTAHVIFVSDEPSPLLQQMQEYSSHTACRFNHTRVFHGTCITHKCKEFYDGDTATDLRVALEACLNQTVYKEYNLRVKVEEDVACQEYNRSRQNFGVVDIVVAVILLVLVICNAVGSIFEFYFTRQNNRPVAQFLLCFSVSGNWKRFTALQEGADKRLERLKGINGIRAISVILVVIAHALLSAVLATANPKFVEDLYDNIIIQVLANGSLIMQTFLFLSAFLLTYNTQLKEMEKTVTWKTLPICILGRWLRLTPSYAIVLAVTATWVPDISSGPLWHLMVTSESQDCRSNWWQHLLYINNYVDDSLCKPETWYLAADIQLYCLGLVVIIFCQSPKSRMVVLPIVLLMGIIIPALHTYHQDLDGVMITSPRIIVGFFKIDQTFNKVYKRGHTNIACYVIGMIFGYLIYNLQMHKFDTNMLKKWRLLYWSMCPFGFIIVASCKVFYEDGPRISLYSRVLISAFIKPVFGLSVAFIIVGMILKIEGFFRGILEWPFWTYLARVSYSVYLLHLTVVRIATGSLVHTLHISYISMIEKVLYSVVVTYAAAFVFWLTVEEPLAQIVKNFLIPVNTRSQRNNEEKKPSSPIKKLATTTRAKS